MQEEQSKKCGGRSSGTSPDRRFKQALTPFEEFVHAEASSGILLMACTVAALVIANSGLLPLYESILHTKITIGTEAYNISHTLHHWINDGLMALFFFTVGLEIKREILVGELADRRQALLPIAGAIGGMVVPALIYVLFNFGTNAISGWGVPMATDIAFALGVLAILGKRIPRALVGFLLALAIVVDLGAVLVIAAFYTEQINTVALAFAGVMFVGLLLSNIAGVSLLAGIGFTMSIFIAGLAFTSPEYLLNAKIGILVASLLAGIGGYTALLFSTKPVKD